MPEAGRAGHAGRRAGAWHAVVLVGTLAVAGPGLPSEIGTLADLRARGATPMTGSELRTLLVGNRVRTSGGRAWTYGADGTLAFVTEQRTGLASRAGSGTWRIDDDGTACLRLVRRVALEATVNEFCSRVYQLDRAYYSVIPHPARDDGAKAHRFEVIERNP